MESDDKDSRGRGECRVYQVEARLDPAVKSFGPKEIGGMMLDCEWRTVSFQHSPIGVSPGLMFAPMAEKDGFYSYAAANALAWWFLSADQRYSCLRVRLVEYRHVYEYSHYRMSETEEFSGEAPRKSAALQSA